MNNYLILFLILASWHTFSVWYLEAASGLQPRQKDDWQPRIITWAVRITLNGMLLYVAYMSTQSDVLIFTTLSPEWFKNVALFMFVLFLFGLGAFNILCEVSTDGLLLERSKREIIPFNWKKKTYKSQLFQLQRLYMLGYMGKIGAYAFATGVAIAYTLFYYA